jgi:Gon7 family
MASAAAANGTSTANDTSNFFQILSASYNSPTNKPFTYNEKLPNPATSAPTDRAAYLSKLRAATVELQKNINAELTQRMEEDKLRAGEGTTEASTKQGVVDESKEEENYGEEVMEDDA